MDKLTPSLTQDQLKQNIDHLQGSGTDNATIQSYVDNYQKGTDGNFVLKNSSTPPAESDGNFLGSMTKGPERALNTVNSYVGAGGQYLGERIGNLLGINKQPLHSFDENLQDVQQNPTTFEPHPVVKNFFDNVQKTTLGRGTAGTNNLSTPEGEKQMLGDTAQAVSLTFPGSTIPRTFASGMLYGGGSTLSKNPDASNIDIGENAVGTGLLAALTHGLIKAIPGTQKFAKESIQALKENGLPTGEDIAGGISNRLLKLNPTDANKFTKMSGGVTPGEYLQNNAIYGSRQNILKQLVERGNQSKEAVDSTLAQIPGKTTISPVTTALNELVERDAKVSSLGAPDPDSSRIQQLYSANKSGGLTMAEQNEVKRLYERNVKLDYLKSGNLPTQVTHANNIDSAIRNAQLKLAEQKGFTNLAELNKNTQLTRHLGDAMFKKMVGQESNNAMNLTDTILLSGLDPKAFVATIGKKILSSEGVQGAAAKYFGNKIQPEIKADFTTQPTPLLEGKQSGSTVFGLPPDVNPNNFESPSGKLFTAPNQKLSSEIKSPEVQKINQSSKEYTTPVQKNQSNLSTNKNIQDMNLDELKQEFNREYTEGKGFVSGRKMAAINRRIEDLGETPITEGKYPLNNKMGGFANANGLVAAGLPLAAGTGALKIASIPNSKTVFGSPPNTAQQKQNVDNQTLHEPFLEKSRGALITPEDLKALRPVLFGEISNRSKDKQELEARVILNTALNRIRENKNYLKKDVSLKDVINSKDYQANSGHQVKVYANPKNSLDQAKKQTIDGIVNKLVDEIKNGTFKDNTQNAYYYKSMPNQSIRYDNTKPLFDKTKKVSNFGRQLAKK